MDILQDITSLKEQGLPDDKVIDLLVLKGAKKEQIEDRLKVYYLNLHSTEVSSKQGSQVPVLLIAISIILLLIALGLGWVIYSSSLQIL